MVKKKTNKNNITPARPLPYQAMRHHRHSAAHHHRRTHSPSPSRASYLAMGYRRKKTPILMPSASKDVAARLTPLVTPVSCGVSRRKSGRRFRAPERGRASPPPTRSAATSSTAMWTEADDLLGGRRSFTLLTIVYIPGFER